MAIRSGALKEEFAAREQVALNVIIKAAEFMRANGHDELAKQWLAENIELETGDG